jgi:hypothetical protein
MTQALYAHMNNKTIKKKRNQWFRYLQYLGNISPTSYFMRKEECEDVNRSFH